MTPWWDRRPSGWSLAQGDRAIEIDIVPTTTSWRRRSERVLIGGDAERNSNGNVGWVKLLLDPERRRDGVG